ncbi:MAG: 2'-5' RNA ligase family protein [Enhydrobacter sp.]|nr:2'-5' RNA ligase family protein [Enhydrobacter sp.]
MPDAVASARIAETARHLRISHGLAGKPVRPDHFHVNLCVLDGRVGPTIDGIESVKESISRVVMPSFRVGFDRAESFRNGALVLRSEEGTIGLDILQQRVSDALDARSGKARPFTPHVTLLHDGYRVPEQCIERIEWTVRELVLVHSEVGSMQRHVARWSLTMHE